MDFSVIFQMREKRFWWMDVIFYFVVSLLVATIFCYVIFLVKNNLQREEIKKEVAALQTVGTEQQKEEEKTVINYQGKVGDFAGLLNNHEFASNAFAFMQAATMPSIWFKQFALDEKNAGVQLSGEADSMDAFSRQVAIFEKNKYVKSISSLNSSMGDSARTQFSINLLLDQNIFSYLSTPKPIIPEVVEVESQTTIPQQNTPTPSPAPAPTPTPAPVPAKTISSEKRITSFHFLDPDVTGVIDQTNYTITLKVPYGTDVKNLTSSMVISPDAVVMPDSGVSQDFESPVTYIVTAQDGSVQSYQVSVVVTPQPVANKKTSQAGSSLLIIIAIAGVIILAIVIILIFVWRKSKIKKPSF